MRDLIPDEVRLNDQKADFSSFCFEILTNADAPGIERLLDAPNPEIGAYVDMEWVRHRWYHDRPAPGRHTGPWGTVIWLIIAGECWLRAQADPGFVDDMLAQRTSAPPRCAGSHSPTPALFSALQTPGALSRVLHEVSRRNRQESKMENHDKDHEKDQVPEYERPSVVDYGTLVDITRASGLVNADSPSGKNNAFSNAA